MFSADWPAHKKVKTLVTTRQGGASKAPFLSFNLGDHVGDEECAVIKNRELLNKLLPSAPQWLSQVHGVDIASLEAGTDMSIVPEADASITQIPNRVCCVMTADCLPVLLCNQQGTQVAAVHAGWRGLLDGIIEQTIAKFDDKDTVLAYLGPAIGPAAFEVGSEVKQAFCAINHEANNAFQASDNEGKWLADIYQLAKIRLKGAAVTEVFGGNYCTYTQQDLFFSYRRDGQTGRMASCIWIED